MVTSTAANFTAALARIVKSQPYGSQTEIAEKLGVSRQYLNDLLAGRKRWTDDLKDKAAHALGTTVQDLQLPGGHWRIDTASMNTDKGNKDGRFQLFQRVALSAYVQIRSIRCRSYADA